MRGNGWQIAAIAAIIFAVILIVPIVIMGRGWSEMNDRMKKAEAGQAETAQKASKLEGDNKILKGLIGKEDTQTDDVKKQHGEDMSSVLPGENATTQTYHAAVVQLDSDLKKEREEHKDTKEELAQLQSDYANAKALHDSIVDKARADLATAEKQRDVATEKFDRTLKTNAGKMQKQERIHSEGLAAANKKASDVEAEKNKIAKERDNVADTNTTLAEQIDAIRNPNVEHPAGKILSVDQRSGLAVVNVGSSDGLLVRTMFSVYDAKITGLSFASTITGKTDPVYCDVCKREISLSTSKASIEVMRILDAHRAEVRILDDVLTDPITVGDVIYSPIWKPGQVQRFALCANMTLPGVDKKSGCEMLRRLIEANGGVVDCWINEENDEKLLAADRIEGSISKSTSFVVVNDDVSAEPDAEVSRAEDYLLKKAQEFAVRKISLQNLLNRMGWKNVTPEYGFGENIFTKDMRVKPGEPRLSHGRTTDLFKPDNAKSRLSAKDIPSRQSEGKISDFYGGKAPAINPSGGKISELFTPGKPKTPE
ncbi:MAG: hypothetical protein LBT89_01475 [Planctomycetaceae bacterium]|jgi:hypothetical protein|nr:hypothetical protein [Planctomycetaceae bacterium]